MRLRFFRRGAARAVQPGDVLERPEQLRVEETVNALTGMKLVGYRPDWARKSTIEVKPDDIVEYPVDDPTEMRDLLVAAFKALAGQIKDDEIRPEQDGFFAYQVLTSGELSVNWKGTTTLLQFETEPEPQTAVVEPAPASTNAPAAKAPAKKAAATEKKPS